MSHLIDTLRGMMRKNWPILLTTEKDLPMAWMGNVLNSLNYFHLL